ncbi:NADP-dependent oxidoreductase [Aquimarina sediminis]|uniref:NADP-dependent oxidoreductase n=1 Tax=Aquimarina sediminis TaxID=2070536 RepID=UPI000CA05964|nr:NADP-dependent oxidoreductase [Aquimarina sediminis]
MNKQIILKKRPIGLPEEDTWELQNNPLRELKEGEILIQQHYVSLDPAMRGWINDIKSYIEPVELDDVMRAGSVGKVIKTNNHQKFKEGDYVTGWGGVQQYVITDGSSWFSVNPTIAPLPLFISTLGMPGMTAYFGILEAGRIKEGDIVLVSGAAGAVGSVVGQIAKLKGCRVIGIAGGAKKCSYLIDELGFDAAIDYKAVNIYDAIKQVCPKGIDVYFDNVGGEILDAALTKLRLHARVVICGAISQYNNKETPKGPGNYLSLLVNRATMQGILVTDYVEDYGKAAIEMGRWMAQGKLKSKEDIYESIENFYETFLRLFSGDKMGKLVLKVLE